MTVLAPCLKLFCGLSVALRIKIQTHHQGRQEGAQPSPVGLLSLTPLILGATCPLLFPCSLSPLCLVTCWNSHFFLCWPPPDLSSLSLHVIYSRRPSLIISAPTTPWTSVILQLTISACTKSGFSKAPPPQRTVACWGAGAVSAGGGLQVCSAGQ